VLAVTVPAGILAGDNLNRSQNGPVVQPSQSVTESATPLPGGPVRLTLDGLERGDDPAVRYLQRQQLVTPEQTYELGRSLQAVVRQGDGWVGLGYAGDGAEVYRFDASLDETGSEPAGERLAATHDGSRVSFVRPEPDGTQTLLSAGAADTMSWRFPKSPGVYPVGYVDQGSVVYGTEWPDPTVGVASGDGSTSVLEPFLGVADANETSGLVAGLTREQPDGSGCSGILEPATSTTRLLWETCAFSLDRFSPDGRYITASDAYRSGYGTTSLSILDAQTGQVLVEYQQRRNSQISLLQSAWESDGALLVVAAQGSTFTMLRLGLDGRIEEALDRVEGTAFGDAPWWFGQTPAGS
jgi:hypothetical protein